MSKMYMCPNCGHRSLEESKLCPECKSKMAVLKAYSESNIEESTVIPGYGKTRILYSIEAAQDMRVAQVALEAYRTAEPTEEEIALWNTLADRGLYGKIRTPDPTEEEIKDWQHYHEFFGKLDLDGVAKHYNVHVIREEEPYADIQVDYADCAHADAFGIPDWMKKAGNFEYFWASFQENKKRWTSS